MRFRAFIVAVSLLLLAGSVSPAGDAGGESPFSLGLGARSIGLGGGVSAFSEDAGAIYYNPAGLAGLEYQEIAFMHSDLLSGSIYDCASWVYPINESHGIGFGVMRLGTDDITRRENYADMGSFDFSHSQFILAYGRNIGQPLSVGANLRIVNQVLGGDSDFGHSMDLGLGLRVFEHLRLGLVARDLFPTKLQLDSTIEETPRSLVGGLSLSKIPLSATVSFSGSIDLEKTERRTAKILAGAELTFHSRYSIRGGYNRDNLALGVGLQYGHLKFDYAYKMVGYAEDLHNMSVSFLIGKSVPEQIRIRQQALLPPEPSEEELQLAALREQADYFQRRFMLDSASQYYRAALELDPENAEIIGTMAAIESARAYQHHQEEQLRQARLELDQTIGLFLRQAEQLLDRRSYQAALDLLQLIFDIDPANVGGRQLQVNIESARHDEIITGLAAARIAESENRLADAIDAYNRVLEVAPGHTEATAAKLRVLATMGLPEKVRLGIELFEKGRMEVARSQFRAILQVNANEPTALDYIRRIEEAQTRTATLEDIQKDSEIWQLYLDGLRFMRNQEYQSAIGAWERVLQKYPNNQDTLNNIEQARLRLESHQAKP